MSTVRNDAASVADESFAFDWRLDIDRLKAGTKASKAAGYHDPRTMVEAECWLDLVKAEIAAQRARLKTAETKASLEELRYWRSSLRHAIRTMKNLAERGAEGPQV